MNVNNGQILEISELQHELMKQAEEPNSFEEQLKNHCAIVEKKDMTKKQEETKQVSLKDHSSKLGKQLTEERHNRKLHRNDLCICGSGKKNKKCCQIYKS